MLAFGEEFPGTGEDTVRTAVKTYHSQSGILLDYRYAADIGFVYLNEVDFDHGLYYARVDGVEHGVAVYPFTVDAEPSPDEAAKLAAEVYPNPFGAAFSVALTLPEAGAVTVEVVDVLGRTVLRQEAGGFGAGRYVLRVAVGRLRAGVYLVRVRTQSGRATTQRVLKL